MFRTATNETRQPLAAIFRGANLVDRVPLRNDSDEIWAELAHREPRAGIQGVDLVVLVSQRNIAR